MPSFERDPFSAEKQTAPLNLNNAEDIRGEKKETESHERPPEINKGSLPENMTPQSKPLTPSQIFLEQHDTGALSTMLQREIEIKARLRKKLEEEFLKKDVSKPPEIPASRVLSETPLKPKREGGEQCNPIVLQEARTRWQHILEQRGAFGLSQEEYRQYFTGRSQEQAGFRQGNVGVCYAVAAIHALSESPSFEIIMRSALRRLPDGTWRVRIPLLGAHGREISISRDEIAAQQNAHYGRWLESRGWDTRKMLHPVQGNEGIRVLEAAYIKSKFGSVDRLAAEGGDGAEVLVRFLGQENVVEMNLDISQSTRQSYDEKGVVQDVSSPLHRFLREFHPEVSMVTVNSRVLADGWWQKTRRIFGRPRRFYRGRGIRKRFVARHAYSLTKVNMEKQIVVLTNPHDTAESIELTFDQLRDNFCYVRSVRLHQQKLHSSMAILAIQRQNNFSKEKV